MKKIIIFGICSTILLSFVGCGENNAVSFGVEKSEEQSQQISDDKPVAIPNPFIETKTIEEAIELAGFDIVLPEDMPEGFEITSIRTIENQMIEVIYLNGDKEIRIRKAKGSDDISGDYNEYSEIVENKEIGDSAEIKGNDGKVSVITWISGDYTFALCADEGMEDSQAISIAKNIK